MGNADLFVQLRKEVIDVLAADGRALRRQLAVHQMRQHVRAAANLLDLATEDMAYLVLQGDVPAQIGEELTDRMLVLALGGLCDSTPNTEVIAPAVKRFFCPVPRRLSRVADEVADDIDAERDRSVFMAQAAEPMLGPCI
ncbi:hypothetical protein WK66_29390 [Burkholderia ubonensis]|nr:hypothetical protein WK66_29390 [Burkholderia ubonensis]